MFIVSVIVVVQYERQTEKEKAAAMTDKLDEEWRKLGWKELEQFRDAIKARKTPVACTACLFHAVKFRGPVCEV